MSGMFRNLGSAYWSNIGDEVSQLQEVSAIAPLNQTTHAIVRFQTSDVGPSSEHNLLRDTPNVVMDDDGNVTNFNSITFTEIASNPGGDQTIWVNSGDDNLYFGSSAISGAGNVSGPGSAGDNNICTFNGVSGHLIKDSGIFAVADNTNKGIILANGSVSVTNRINSVLIGDNILPATVTSVDNVIIAPNCGLHFASPNGNVVLGTNIMYQSSANPTTSVNNNVLIGDHIASTVADLSSITNNVVIGSHAGESLITGADANVILGVQSGQNATDNTNVIYLLNAGVASEDDTIRIGTSQTDCYVAGIYNNNTVTGIPQVVLTDSANHLSSGINLDSFLQMGSVYFENFTPFTLALTMNTPTIVNPSVTYKGQALFDSSSAGVIRYLGADLRNVYISYSVTGAINGALSSGNIQFYLAINGVQLAGTQTFVSFESNLDYRIVSSASFAILSTNSLISLMANNFSTSDDLDITSFCITALVIA